MIGFYQGLQLSATVGRYTLIVNTFSFTLWPTRGGFAQQVGGYFRLADTLYQTIDILNCMSEHFPPKVNY